MAPPLIINRNTTTNMKRYLIILLGMSMVNLQSVVAQDLQGKPVPLAANQASLSKTTTREISNLPERLSQMQTSSGNEIFSITIAADVPDNTRPHKVYVKKEPGHVFVILEKKDTVNNITQSLVWGFYPVRPINSVFMKNVRCKLNDNGGRTYDASITKALSAAEFDVIIRKANDLAQKRYNLNKYNCYDYAVELFNAVQADHRLPLTHVKFPFIFGRGGSPCGLYRDLVDLKKRDFPSSESIQIGLYNAPLTTTTTGDTGDNIQLNYSKNNHHE